MEESRTLIEPGQMDAILALDETVRESRLQMKLAEDKGNMVLRGMLLARATRRIRDALTPEMMQDIQALQNTPLGFKTDKPDGYPDAALRDVCIVAMLDGARVTGNEFNIIAGNYYRTLEQLRRRIQQFPGLRNFRFDLGIPQTHGAGALVPASATWTLDGQPDCIQCVKTDAGDTRIPVRVNSGMGADGIHGKARRKLFYRVLERLTGSNLDEDEQVEPEADADYTASPELTEAVNGVAGDHTPACGDPQTVDAVGAPSPEDVTNGNTPTEPDEATPEETEAAQFLATFWPQFEACTGIAQTNELLNKIATETNLTDEQVEVLTNMRDDRQQAIRNQRGPRSKPAQRELDV